MLEQAIMYNKHKILLNAEIEDGKVKRIEKCFDTEHLPVSLQWNLTEDTLNRWLSKRKIPESREGYAAFRRDFPEAKDSRCMFSLSDQYWFRYAQEETWDTHNFFTNPYSEDFGRAFFMPWEFGHRHIFQPSPDMTTNGALKKRWARGEDGTSYLLKAGSRALHQEPVTEVLASIMLQKLDIIPYVEYELVVDSLRLCSKCRNFVDKDTEFVPASHIYFKEKRPKERSIYDHLLMMCGKYAPAVVGAQKYVDAMIVADHVIGNDDRHMGNFGFLRDVETGVITGFAPLFDSGSSYSVINGKPKGSKYFSDKEKDALRRIARKIDPDKVRDHKEAFSLIDSYPEISKLQRDVLKEFLEDMEKELIAEIEQEASVGRIGVHTHDGPSF